MSAGTLAPPLDELRRDRVRAWRQEMLLALGVSEEDAYYLSLVRDLDWHDAERLVTRGCPPELLLELLI